MNTLTKTVTTLAVVYLSAASVRGCQMVRSPEMAEATSMGESTAYVMENMFRDHPEYLAELANKDAKGAYHVGNMVELYIGHGQRMKDLECRARSVVMPWKSCSYNCLRQ
ncbi:MAG: hypothetical protein ABIG89_00025 [Candidatus Woesearchaeota archaeon]